MPLEVEVGASVDDEDDFLVDVEIIEDEDSESVSSARRLRSAASRSSPCPLGFGGGLRSTRMVPERASRANVDPSGSEAADRPSISCPSTNCSSIYNVGDADDSDMQHVRNMNKRKSCWELVCGLTAR